MEITSNLTGKAQNDYRLVCLAKQGDQKAYVALMNAYRDSLYFMLLKMTNNAADADDLTIEAFGKAFKNIHQYTPDYAFSTWLFKIASNNCIDFIRKQRTKTISIDNVFTTQDGDSISYNLPNDDLDPEEFLMAKQKKRMLREVVDKLKPHYRQLVELRYFKEYSYEEIAQELELPLGTVKAKLFRARDFLYNILRNTEDVI